MIKTIPLTATLLLATVTRRRSRRRRGVACAIRHSPLSPIRRASRSAPGAARTSSTAMLPVDRHSRRRDSGRADPAGWPGERRADRVETPATLLFQAGQAQVIVSGWQAGDELIVNSTTRIEMDGLIRVDVVVLPQHRRSPKLEQLCWKRR